ncbi:hypothetical protein NJ7G_3714 [Natrinema sp. J7-2]|nr:hypothetical protein NJ7G_3714 [Natrinema sp. J7-2]
MCISDVHSEFTIIPDSMTFKNERKRLKRNQCRDRYGSGLEGRRIDPWNQGLSRR